MAANTQLTEMRKLGFKLLDVTTRMGEVFDQIAAEYGLTGLQARTVLEMDAPTPMNELAKSMGCDASNVTGLAKRLERLGLVERITGQDRRMKLLVLTADRGLPLRDELAKSIATASPVMARLTAKERTTLDGLLDKLLG